MRERGRGILSLSPPIDSVINRNLPEPLFTEEGDFLPLAKGGEEGLNGKFAAAIHHREDSRPAGFSL
jgi:hypothetical protein